jgi:hypothetical protein
LRPTVDARLKSEWLIAEVFILSNLADTSFAQLTFPRRSVISGNPLCGAPGNRWPARARKVCRDDLIEASLNRRGDFQSLRTPIYQEKEP